MLKANSEQQYQHLTSSLNRTKYRNKRTKVTLTNLSTTFIYNRNIPVSVAIRELISDFDSKGLLLFSSGGNSTIHCQVRLLSKQEHEVALGMREK